LRINMLKFSKKEKAAGKKIYRKFTIEKKKNPKAPLISFDGLNRLLDDDEKKLIEKVLSVNPKDYGKNHTIFYGIDPVPKDLVAIENQTYFPAENKDVKKVKTQYLPKAVFVAFLRMKKAMKKELGKAVNVTSGYRSPAFQALILFTVLFQNKWSMKKTLLRLTLPGCSEHGYPPRQAMDLAPEKGIKNLEDFNRTEEYKWLLKNAKKFCFRLSYPKNNNYGVMFEPWHWRYVKHK